MAVHNGEPHLRESIDSILQQSFTDFEFLIIDDASSDHSRDIILSYQDQRIRFVSNQTKLGLTRSLNRGLRLALGDLIARQDADDVSERHRLARQRDFLDANPQAALVGTWYKKIDERNSDLGTRQLPCDWLEIRWALLFLCPFVHSAVMLRKAILLDKVGVYDESLIYAQDYELWSRIAHELPVANLPEYLVRYRMSPRSMTSTYGDIVQAETLRTSIANLAVLIGRAEATRLVESDAAIENIRALIFGDYRRLTTEEAISAARRSMWLLSAFTRHSEAQQYSFRVRLRYQIARRLIEISRYRATQGLDGVAQLVAEAYRICWLLLFKRQSLRALLNLMKQHLPGKPSRSPRSS